MSQAFVKEPDGDAVADDQPELPISRHANYVTAGGLALLKESLAALISGVEMTERELISVFERHGVRRIEPMGEKFDHNLHQAMFHVDASDQPDGTIIEVVQVGYVIADRLLRPAMVGVAKAAARAEDDAAVHIDTEA